MPKDKLWVNSVPRVEYDQRAREARRRLEGARHLPARRSASAGSRLLRVLREALVAVSGGSRESDRGKGSSKGQRPGGTPPAAICFLLVPAMVRR